MHYFRYNNNYSHIPELFLRYASRTFQMFAKMLVVKILYFVLD